MKVFKESQMGARMSKTELVHYAVSDKWVTILKSKQTHFSFNNITLFSMKWKF